MKHKQINSIHHTPETEPDNRVISDPKEVQNELRNIFDIEEQNRIFDLNRKNEVSEYFKMIVEAKTLPALARVKTLIINRSFVLDREFKEVPELKDSRKELKKLLKYVTHRIKELKGSTQNPNNATDSGMTVFQTIFDETQLKEIYARSMNAKVIKCSEVDFLYWFGGKGTSGRKIKWLLKSKEDKPHKSALQWYCQQLNPESEPAGMNEIFNVEVDSNNKGYSVKKEMKDIFNNL